MLKTRIKEIRQSKGMSLRMLADISGTSKESIINLETGRTDPKLSTLLAVADALRVPLAELFDEPQPAQQRVGCRLRREQAGLPGHRLSSRKCHSRMLPAMPAFRLSTRSVMGMRTVLLQAAMVSSVRP